MQLAFSPNQVLIVGLVATVLASVLGWLIQTAIPWFVAKVWKKPITIDLGRFVKTILVGLVALGLAWWWYPVSLPALPLFTGTFINWVVQFLTWLPILAAALTPYLGASMAVYNLILGYITDPDRRAKIIKMLLDWLFPNGPPLKLP
jgi:hypothetical protein